MSAYAKLQGSPVIEARVSFPRVGVWSAELRVDTTEKPAGKALLELGESGFVGAVVISTLYQSVSYVRLAGGAGGMATELEPKGYIGSPISVPLGDIAREAGEALSATVDRSVTNAELGHWSRASGPAGTALALLLGEVPGAAWRFLPSGELWVGAETWPDASQGLELEEYEPLRDKVRVFSLVPGVLPGTKVLGRRVSYVEHRIAPAKLATHIWFEEEA